MTRTGVGGVRITIEGLEAAYAVTGLSPCLGAYVSGRRRADGVAVLAIAIHGRDRYRQAVKRGTVGLAELLGIDREYLAAFVLGWDGTAGAMHITARAWIGWRDGLAAGWLIGNRR